MASSSSSSSAPRGSGKRLVNQDELRRLMREKQRQSGGRKRVESPLARYNRLGQLSCALCNAPVKSELLWPTHVLGRQHRERVAGLRGARAAAPDAAPDGAPDGGPGGDAKRRRTGGPSDAAAGGGLPSGLSAQSGPSRPALLPDYAADEDDDDEDDDDDEEEKRRQRGSAAPAPAPAPHSGSIEKADAHGRAAEQQQQQRRRENTAEALPEGFFDDPEADARVRKVDAPKDQMDKEWDEFQRAMRQVSSVSEAIVAEEDEEGRLDRQIGEIDEQIECYRRVENLRDRRDALRGRPRATPTRREPPARDQPDADGDSDGEGELQDLLSQDWRVKGALL